MNATTKQQPLQIREARCLLIGAAMSKQGYPITQNGLNQFLRDAALKAAEIALQDTKPTKQPA